MPALGSGAAPAAHATSRACARAALAAAVADGADRLRGQPVGRRTHEEAQVIDRGEVTQASAYCPQYVTQS